MTVLVLLETVLLVVLTVLVAGLLRAYATVLKRLHRLDGGEPDNQFRLEPAAAPVQSRDDWTTGHDVAGESVQGELVSARVVGVEHDTVLLFLSSGCTSCAVFWDELSRPVLLPAATRLVIVTQGEEVDSRAAIAELAPSDVDVIMSTAAWQEYEVPGSPHVVYVEGQTGRVRGEGTGQSWGQVAQLLASATGDSTYLTGDRTSGKPRRDSETEAAVDRELMAAGIYPGDARLYQ
jgi:hypothetical protein